MTCVLVAFVTPASAQLNGTPPQIQSRAPVGPIFGGCTTGHVFAKADSTTGIGTSSETFVDIPNMSVGFPVNPGPHTVAIQFRSLFGASVFVHPPTMTVFTK